MGRDNIKPIILGIDVGIAITGWSILEIEKTNLVLIDFGAITTKASESMPNRLLKLHNGLKEVIDTYHPTEMAVEELFYFKNKKTIISVGQARGVIVMTGELLGLQVYGYTPLEVKTAVTGYGRASKQQIQQMVTKIFKLKETPKPDDVADAIAVAFCHTSSKKYNEASNASF